MEVSDAYVEARRQFTELAAGAGFQVQSHDTGLRGPSNDGTLRLTTDVAVANFNVNSHVLLVTTGLHGVEGHLGSAVLLDALTRWQRQLPSCRCVLMHSLNPYGHALNRRCDEANVDLNRNFLDDDQQYTGGPPMYSDLDSLLNPTTAPKKWDAFALQAFGYVVRYGMSPLQRAVAEGQYDFPRGLFFGGEQAAPANKFLREQLPQLLSGAAAVTHIDVHSGLGRWANLQLLVDVSPTQAQRRWLIDCGLGYRCTAESSTGYFARGSLGSWIVRQGLADDYLYVCAEFGTHPPIRVLSALRRENQAHHYLSHGTAGWLAEKMRLLEVFFPASRSWRETVLARAARLLEEAQRRV